MREIVTDWGVDESHFQRICRNTQKAYGSGVTVSGNCMQLDNQYAKGKLEFLPLNDKMAVLKMRITFAEPVLFKRVVHKHPDYYCCLFSLKEGVDLHAFNAIDTTEMKALGMSANHAILYFSADIQTMFRVIPNEQTRLMFVIFKRGAFGYVLENSDFNRELLFLGNGSVKGYAGMNSEIIERATNMLDYEGTEILQRMHSLGAVYQLMAATFRQIECERKMLTQTTGTVEVAKMVQIRNLLVSDFSSDCPLLEAMAKKAQMSATKFKNLFKQLFKLPYYQYYQRCRLLAAKQSIAYGKTVTETAYEFGFNSVSNFSVAFKKMFNISPSEIERESANSNFLMTQEI